MLTGTIIYASNDHIAIASDNDSDRVFHVDPMAVVRLNGQTSKLAELRPGDSVRYAEPSLLVIEAFRLGSGTVKG